MLSPPALTHAPEAARPPPSKPRLPPEINFQPKAPAPRLGLRVLRDPLYSIREFRARLSGLAREKYRLLKFLNVIKPREYFFERFYWEFNALFEQLCLAPPGEALAAACLAFLAELANFYRAELPRLSALRNGVLFALFEALWASGRPLLALLGEPLTPVAQFLRDFEPAPSLLRPPALAPSALRLDGCLLSLVCRPWLAELLLEHSRRAPSALALARDKDVHRAHDRALLRRLAAPADEAETEAALEDTVRLVRRFVISPGAPGPRRSG